MKINLLHAIWFDKNYWTDKLAREWLINHNYKYINNHATNNYLGYRINDPINDIGYKTIKLPNHINLVFQITEKIKK